MAAPKLKPFATDTARCNGGWKKGMGLKIDANAANPDELAFEKVDAATDDVDAVALQDCADGESGLICFGGIVPLRVTGVNVTAHTPMVCKADATWGLEAAGAAAGVPRSAKALVNYDLRNLTGLVTAIFLPTNTKNRA